MQEQMSDDDLDTFAASGARLLGLAIAPDWRASVRANLRVSLGHGHLVAAFRLPDEADPAPVFSA